MITELKDSLVLTNIEARDKEAVVLLRNRQTSKTSARIFICYNNTVSSSLHKHSSIIVLDSSVGNGSCSGESGSFEDIYKDIAKIRNEMLDNLNDRLTIKTFEDYISYLDAMPVYLKYIKKDDILLAVKPLVSVGSFVMFHSEGKIKETGGGTYFHNSLKNREYVDSHPMSAITGLVDSLALKSESTHIHSWDMVTNKPITFTPSPHTHITSQITDINLFTDTKIDNLEIGCRNHFLHDVQQSDWYGNTIYQNVEYNPSGLRFIAAGTEGIYRAINSVVTDTDRLAGKDVIVSFDAYSENVTSALSVWLDSANVGLINIILHNRYKRYYLKVKNFDIQAKIVIANTTDGVRYYIRNFKLEKGNKTTDWTRAPEDVWNKTNSNSFRVDWKAKNLIAAGSIVMYSV